LGNVCRILWICRVRGIPIHRPPPTLFPRLSLSLLRCPLWIGHWRRTPLLLLILCIRVTKCIGVLCSPRSSEGYDCSCETPLSLYMACSSSKVGHSDVGCSSVHRPPISMTFNGHSFSPCFFRHLGQKIAKTISSSCFFFRFRVSNWLLIVLKMSILKFSHKFPKSILVTIPKLCLVFLLKESLGALPVLACPLEYLLQ
jgi:hypothetical protein